MLQSTSNGRISEFDWLKVLGLFLLIFVHSDLTKTYPQIVTSFQWILISIFFFVSGYLAYSSFHKRLGSIKKFFKSKFWALYIPFVAATCFYFAFENYFVGTNPLKLLAQISLLDVFDNINTGLFNYGFLWFIPYLLVFFFAFCLLEKYVKNIKIQVTLVLLVWFVNLFAWVFDNPASFSWAYFKLGLVFNQYFLVFMLGFWLSKYGLYNRMVRFRTALFAVPLFALFFLDFSGSLSFSDPLTGFEHYLYGNVRSMALGLSVIFIFLAVAKGRVSSNKVVESIAKVSLLIYLTEPFLSYLLRDYIFGGQLHIYVSNSNFIWYQVARIVFLFGLLPLLYVAAKKYGVLTKISSRLKFTQN
jgi:fucose 4-O-acetylase-like acetyltransferase